jgi:CBS domain-containing protein
MFRRRNRGRRGSRLTAKDRDLVQRLQEILEPIGYRVTVFAAPGGTAEAWKMGMGKAREMARDMAAVRADALAGLPKKYLWLGLAGLFLGGLLWRRKRAGRYVRDVMVADVETIPSSATIVEAAQRMRDANVGVLPIVEDGRVRGVITDRDLVIRGLARGIDSSSIVVGQCATRQAVTVKADWSVNRALSLMAEHQIGRVPVIDDDDRVIGIVTLSSLARRSREEERVLDTAKGVSERSARAS